MIGSNVTQGRRCTFTTFPLKKGVKTTTNERSASAKRDQSQKTKIGLRCYNCQPDGHIARYCSQSRRSLMCLKYKKDGHTAKYYKTDMPEVKLGISIATKNSAIYYIKEMRINNNNQPVSGLVDTSNAFRIIRKSIGLDTIWIVLIA